MSHTTTETTAPYDRNAIFLNNGTFNPSFMREAVRAMMRTLPLDPKEPKGWSDRRMHAALLGLSALHPLTRLRSCSVSRPWPPITPPSPASASA